MSYLEAIFGNFRTQIWGKIQRKKNLPYRWLAHWKNRSQQIQESTFFSRVECPYFTLKNVCKNVKRTNIKFAHRVFSFSVFVLIRA